MSVSAGLGETIKSDRGGGKDKKWETTIVSVVCVSLFREVSRELGE